MVRQERTHQRRQFARGHNGALLDTDRRWRRVSSSTDRQPRQPKGPRQAGGVALPVVLSPGSLSQTADSRQRPRTASVPRWRAPPTATHATANSPRPRASISPCDTHRPGLGVCNQAKAQPGRKACTCTWSPAMLQIRHHFRSHVSFSTSARLPIPRVATHRRLFFFVVVVCARGTRTGSLGCDGRPPAAPRRGCSRCRTLGSHRPSPPRSPRPGSGPRPPGGRRGREGCRPPPNDTPCAGRRAAARGPPGNRRWRDAAGPARPPESQRAHCWPNGPRWV